ncbi:Transcriptional regulatory protein AfsQ1 [Planctomycetes bacterium CA13]|uniref:Transcriptional regulatory protein AfsQ1 n=1 Tax=Novipirellula herctigrandis TaxID=2527986 RepID=A0A5C5Z906_9BACT|nr:Transcriptional regulatory protein AfsQ1 [Planctomycetes bacterium CA13]
MSEKTVLVIDDSATIRKLVDTHLTPAGFRVVLAPNAEDGLQLAAEVNPDLILLDHQLPGTTGYEVCCRLVESPKLCRIPVVVSSTLRKKAYAEYLDLDNVVDMLPKPYTEELLQSTVANAIETAVMVVTSQSGGTAVPEVIEQLEDADVSGSFAFIGLRELIDFLTNGRKTGVLEVEAERSRIRFHLNNGRIQGVYASGVESEEIDRMVSLLPQSLVNLAPVLRMTIGGRSCAEVDGFVQLLNQKVLDPRLMTKLLRFQAAMLVHSAFTRKLSKFRFDFGNSPNALHKNLPLDISLLALLVEGAFYNDDSETTELDNRCYVRRAIRGQNLDRAGLSARHMKVLNVLSEPKDANELASALGWNTDEVHQVMRGFVMAEIVEQRTHQVRGEFVVFEPNAVAAQNLRTSLEDSDNRYVGKVVRDQLALKLLLKRVLPHTLIFAADDESSCQMVRKLFATQNPNAARIKRIALVGSTANDPPIDWMARVGFDPQVIIARPCTAELMFREMDRLLAGGKSASNDAREQHVQSDAPPVAPVQVAPLNQHVDNSVGVQS